MSTKSSGQGALRVTYGERIEVRPSSMPLLKPHRLRESGPDGRAAVLQIPNVRSFRGAFSLREARHNFVIECLPKSGWFKPQPYLYTCARCKWAFLINDPRGSILPLDRTGGMLPQSEWARRIETFAEGPCPAFPADAVAGKARPARAGWMASLFAFVSKGHPHFTSRTV